MASPSAVRPDDRESHCAGSPAMVQGGDEKELKWSEVKMRRASCAGSSAGGKAIISRTSCAGSSAGGRGKKVHVVEKNRFEALAPLEGEDEGVSAGSPAHPSGFSAGSSACPARKPDEVEEEEGEEEEEECEAPKRIAIPVGPTMAEIDEHELMGHVQYRSWCRHCVASRGVGQSHAKYKVVETKSSRKLKHAFLTDHSTSFGSKCNRTFSINR